MFSVGGFTFRVATTTALVEAAHRLRYKVYVEEYGYEKPEDHPGGLEKDAFDPYSIQFVASDVHGRIVGTSRLVQNSPLGLPALKLAGPHYKDKNPASPKILEVSRFALAKSLRGKVKDNFQDLDFYLKKICAGAVSQEGEGIDKRVVVVLGLIQIMAQTGAALGVSDYYIMSERRLVVLLKRHGVIYRQVGPEVEHHGTRACYMAHAGEIHPVIFHFRNKLVRTLGKLPSLPPIGLALSLGPCHITLADTEEERAQAQALADQYPLALASAGPDFHDAKAFHILAKDENERPVATARVLLNSPMGLPALERAYPEHQVGSRRVAEISRFAILPAETALDRRRQKAAILGILRLVQDLASGQRITGLYMALDPVWAQNLLRHGWPLTRAGQDRVGPWLLRFSPALRLNTGPLAGASADLAGSIPVPI